MSDFLTHPEAGPLVDSLVASQGGLLFYEFGAPGREIAVAAGARLAAERGTALTVVAVRHLLPQARSVVEDVRPGLTCTLLPPGEAVQRPHQAVDGVLVLHVDLLQDPGTREALLAMAGSAGNVVVASGGGAGEAALNTLHLARFVLRQAASAAQPAPGGTPSPATGQQRQSTGPGIATSRPHAPEAPWRPASVGQREQRLLRQNSRQAEPPNVEEVTLDGSREMPVGQGQALTAAASLEGLRDAVADNPEGLRQRIARVTAQQEQRTAGYPAPGVPQRLGRDHGQEQSAAHQQQSPRGIGLA
jgi:hypothetical protein